MNNTSPQKFAWKKDESMKSLKNINTESKIERGEIDCEDVHLTKLTWMQLKSASQE
jgi:hypothetical protein